MEVRAFYFFSSVRLQGIVSVRLFMLYICTRSVLPADQFDSGALSSMLIESRDLVYQKPMDVQSVLAPVCITKFV